ncbi:MAG: hypothetical protein DRJ44_02385 [Thermoprotei archaeon]|nr:MAG: hypothetical protein DRJ44_02385 [Thermoprotei archaeon]
MEGIYLSKVAPLLAGEKCSFCGACISICPLKSIEIEEDYPKFDPEKCTECGLCNKVCPILNMKFFVKELPILEAYTARTRLPEVREKGQDGGVVTTLLLALFEEGYINGAIVSSLSENEPLKPVPLLAKSKEDILASAGTRYSSSPNLSVLREAKINDAIAVVGVPCQIRAIRLIENAKLKRYANPIKLRIGLFCMENYAYRTYVDELLSKFLRINPLDVNRANIKAGKFIVYLKNGEIKKVPVHDLKDFVRTSCKSCPDLTAEYADISVGGIGSEKGWSTVFIRTDIGKEVFDKVVNKGYLKVKPLSEKGRKLIAKLSSIKKKNAERT